jgi:hypothetical protein
MLASPRQPPARATNEEAMMQKLGWSFVFAAACGLVGCATSFTGEAHVEGGPAGCQKKCEAWGMDFAGMVAMGEYSDACVCHVRGKQAAASESQDIAAVAGGAAGVVLQARRAQEQASQ